MFAGSWKDPFLAALRQSGVVTQACEACAIDRTTPYKAREVDPEFAAAWDAIFDGWHDEIEGALYSRARDGWREEVYYQGEQCGTVIRHDNRLGMWILERRRPEKWGEKKPDASDPNLFAAAIRTFLDAARSQDTAEGDTGAEADPS